MARGTQLLQLVTMLRDESGRNDSVAVGVDETATLKQILRRTQNTLYERHTWEHLRTLFDRIPLQAGERYYDFPDTLNFDRVEEVAVWDGSLPRPVTRGISFREYAIYDSEHDVRADPALRWDVRWTGDKEQIEIWPVPASNNLSLQFLGIRKCRPLIANSDVCDLDDHLIVLSAAAELMPKGSEQAKIKAGLAADRLSTLLRNAAQNRPTYRMGSGPVAAHNPGRVVISVSR